MARVVITGGGWAGCAAALAARQAGADEVVVLERSDQLRTEFLRAISGKLP